MFTRVHLLFIASLLCVGCVLLVSCGPSSRDGSRGDDDDGGSSCFTDVDCVEGEEYCRADDAAVSPEGQCAALEPAGGPCLWGSQCSGDLFCLKDGGSGEGTCRPAPSSCSNGPACNCDPMLEMCAAGGLSCDGSGDSVTLTCNNGPANGLGDDDDGDDDDATSDDDDASSDDDDATGGLDFDGLTFSMELTATQGAGGVTGIAASYTFSYWRDYTNQVTECNQVVSVEGTASFGSGILSGCNNCTGRIDLDENTRMDVSQSAARNAPCDAGGLTDAGANFGDAMLTTITNGGYGDFLTMGLIDGATLSSLGLDLAAAGGYSEADMTATWAEYGLTFTHAGYVANEVGSLSEGSGLDTVSAPAGPGSNWYGYWQLFLNATENTHGGTDLVGDYGGQAVWVIQFQQD